MSEYKRESIVQGSAGLMASHSHRADRHLPPNYRVEGHKIFFPAGVIKSYVIDGIDFNPDGDRSEEEQLEAISKYLKCSRDEVDGLLEGIETKQGSPKFLNSEESAVWLNNHPEIEEKLKRVLKDARSKVSSLPPHQLSGATTNSMPKKKNGGKRIRLEGSAIV